MNAMKPEDRLRQLLAERPHQTLIVVGAGVTLGAIAGSNAAQRASWGGLIRHGIDFAVNHGRLSIAEAETIRGMLSSTRTSMWIAAAEQLWDVLGAPKGGDFRVWLREAVGTFSEQIQDRSVLDTLADLQQAGAILATVNYDGILEEVTGLRPITWRERSEVERVLLGQAQGILHLHGYWDQPESVVFGSSSYTDVVNDGHAREVLKAIRTTRSIVFIGLGGGLDDPNWKTLLDWSANIFAQSENYHYRIVCETDREEQHDPDGQARRILPVFYRSPYSNLGPFLRGVMPRTPPRATVVAPASVSTPSSPEDEVILLLVHIRGGDYTPVTGAQVIKHGKVPRISTTIPINLKLDFDEARPRDWLEVSKKLDELLEKAQQAAEQASGNVSFVIAGRAPLPVFAYLGYRSRYSLDGPILFVNMGAGWERVGPFVGPHEFPRYERRAFETKAPEILQTSPGRLALFVGSSTEYADGTGSFLPLGESLGSPLSTIYRIVGTQNHKQVPLMASDLDLLVGILGKTLAEMGEKRATGLVMALAGPAWMAFWVGRFLNSYRTGLIEFVRQGPKGAYVASLCSDMSRRRLADGMPSVLALLPEPHDKSKTRSGEALDALRQAVDRWHGADGTKAIEPISAVRVEELMARISGRHADILQIYGHGGEHALGIQDAAGHAFVIGEQELVTALRSAGIAPYLVVVTACFSKTLMPALLEISELVVAVDGKALQTTSIMFLQSFYSFLAQGESVATAFDRAKTHVHLQPKHDEKPFLLEFRPDVDPANVIFWPKPHRR